MGPPGTESSCRSSGDRETHGRPHAPVENVTLLPFWIAERAPTWPEEIPSAVIGITQATCALDLLQALQEATYHRLAQIAAEIEKASRRKLSFHRFRRNPKFTQLPSATGRCPRSACLRLVGTGGLAARRGLFCHGEIGPQTASAKTWRRVSSPARFGPRLRQGATAANSAGSATQGFRYRFDLQRV